MLRESPPQRPQGLTQKKAVLQKYWSSRMKRNALRKWSRIHLMIKVLILSTETHRATCWCSNKFLFYFNVSWWVFTLDKLVYVYLKRPVNITLFFVTVGVSGLYCGRNWDGWLCWDDTPAGTLASQNCPDYFRDFDPTGEQWGWYLITISWWIRL